jgi:hypothetical protein
VALPLILGESVAVLSVSTSYFIAEAPATFRRGVPISTPRQHIATELMHLSLRLFRVN